MKTEVQTWKCKECGKEYVSLSKKQLEYWVFQHQYQHKQEKVKYKGDVCNEKSNADND